MTFHIITVFPKLFEPYLNESILGRAVARKLVGIKLYDLRKYTQDKHGKIDDKAYGGGPGMVIAIDPLVRALKDALKNKNKKKTKVLIMAPGGKMFDDRKAKSLSKYDHLVLIAGRYEGIDGRVGAIIKSGFGMGVEEISVGPYVLTGGELPALSIIDAVSRKLVGVLGKAESLEEARYGVGVPVYTKPSEYKFGGKRYKVPKAIISGNHGDIDKWRKERGEKTK